MRNIVPCLLISFNALILSLFFQIKIYGQVLDRLPLAGEVNYSPAEAEIIATNPPSFIWLTLEGVDKYVLQYSKSSSFEDESTTTIRDLNMTVHIPDDVLKPGTWYWRYGYEEGAKDLFSRSREFTIPEDATILPFVSVNEVISRIPKTRPRLHFSPELVEEIRSDAEGRYAYITEKTIQDARDILAMNEPLFEEPEPWEKSEVPFDAHVHAWRTMRPYTQRMVTSALAYLYTGEISFAEEAKRRLMDFMEWDVEGVSTSVGWDELGMDIIENATPVFDWIYPVLNEAERKKCKEVLAARLHQISYDVHRARPMETRPFASHQGRMIGFVIEGSIVLAHDVPEVTDWFEYTLKLLWSTYPAWGHNDGGWHEGPAYWRSYMGRMFRALAELDRLDVPLKNKPFFRNTGYFGLYATYPGRPTSAFGDGHQSPIGRSYGDLMYILSSLYPEPHFTWHAEVSGANPPLSRTAFLFGQPKSASRPPTDIPQSHAFKDVGLVAMHSDMAKPEENVTMMFQSNPFGSISHNYACQNAFVIEAIGEPLAISSGTYQFYGSPHHREWTWQTKAHNSILVDHQGQVPRSGRSHGKIIEYEEKGDYVYTTGDATSAYDGRLDRFHRHILFIRPDYFIIIDDLKTSGKASTFQWLLHSPTEITIDQDEHIMINRSGNVRLTSRFLIPHDLEYKQHTGFTPQAWDSTRWQNQFHITASTIEPVASKFFVTIMKVDHTSRLPARGHESPSTPRKEIPVNPIEYPASLDEDLIKAELIEAEGGLAIRLGNDLILWRNYDDWKVEADGIISTRRMELRKDHFK